MDTVKIRKYLIAIKSAMICILYIAALNTFPFIKGCLIAIFGLILFLHFVSLVLHLLLLHPISIEVEEGQRVLTNEQKDHFTSAYFANKDRKIEILHSFRLVLGCFTAFALRDISIIPWFIVIEVVVSLIKHQFILLTYPKLIGR